MTVLKGRRPLDARRLALAPTKACLPVVARKAGNIVTVACVSKVQKEKRGCKPNTMKYMCG